MLHLSRGKLKTSTPSWVIGFRACVSLAFRFIGLIGMVFLGASPFAWGSTRAFAESLSEISVDIVDSDGVRKPLAKLTTQDLVLVAHGSKILLKDILAKSFESLTAPDAPEQKAAIDLFEIEFSGKPVMIPRSVANLYGFALKVAGRGTYQLDFPQSKVGGNHEILPPFSMYSKVTGPVRIVATSFERKFGRAMMLQNSRDPLPLRGQKTVQFVCFSCHLDAGHKLIEKFVKTGGDHPKSSSFSGLEPTLNLAIEKYFETLSKQANPTQSGSNSGT